MRACCSLSIAVTLLAAAPAAACIAPPPPDWGRWIGDPAYPMFLGRVSAIEVQPAREVSGFTVVGGVGRIVGIEIVQGEPGVLVAETSGALELTHAADRPVDEMICFNFLKHQVGDLVVVVRVPYAQRPLVFSQAESQHSALIPFFEKHP